MLSTLKRGALTIHRMLDRRATRLAFIFLGAILASALLPMRAEALLPIFLGETSTRRDLKTILKEARTLQDATKGRAMTAEEGTKFEALAKEAKEIQDELDREKVLLDMQKSADEQKELDRVVDPAIPGSGKSEAEIKMELKNRVAGYVRLGDFITLSPQLKQFFENGMPRVDLKFAVPNLLKVRGLPQVHQGLLPVSRDVRKAIESIILERKDLPIFGSRVIEPDRLSDMVVDTENDRLRLRDILNVSTTTSNAIEWVAKLDYTRAADVVSDGDEKPEAAAEFELRSTTVKTIAVWIPVTEQQLQDAPVLINLIQQDLLYDLGKVEEEQIMWETGSGFNFNGLVNQIDEGRTSGGDTLIDMIRRSMTDIRIDGYEPNGLAMHPLDVEAIQLLKASDGNYIWIVVTDPTTGQMRIWGLTMVETVACADPAGTTRVAIPGDWRRGATLFDRQQASIAIGYKDDDFIRNLRTIRAEERIAFAVRRPKAFRKITTASP